MQAESRRLRTTEKTIGFVPTMGYLHDGHLSLLQLARPKCDVLVASIFVNPTQFRPNEDFNEYPRDLERDQKLLESTRCDILYYPSPEEMYPDNFQTYVRVEQIGDLFEGASRPGFFRGVATVVSKLFNIVQPHFAVFGQKDAQQAVVIKRMVRDLNFDVEIMVGPTIREADGLAMSSRNSYLSHQERGDARVLYRSLMIAKETIEQGEKDAGEIISEIKSMIEAVSSATIDYVALVNPETFVEIKTLAQPVLIIMAVKIGSTRLIDNLFVTPK